MFLCEIEGWPHDGLKVAIRYSRGSAFSGTCYYRAGQIYVNLGRRNKYPYPISAGIARTESRPGYWTRDIYSVIVADEYELVLFVFMHEFYHWLVYKARRNTRQKEGRCDRFATRVLVDRYGAPVHDSGGRPVPRRLWDFQDLDGFVAAARRAGPKPARPKPAVAATVALKARHPLPGPAHRPKMEAPPAGEQLWLPFR